MENFHLEVKKDNNSELYAVDLLGLRESLGLAIAYTAVAKSVALISNKTAEVLFDYHDDRDSGGKHEIYITPKLCLVE